MATNTTNYNFKKPDESDFYDVQDQNGNWDAADRALKELETNKVGAEGGDIKDTKVSEFTASSVQWPVPAAGEAPKTLWGKVKKFFEDFKTWSTGVCLLAQLVSNTSTNNSNLPASAAAVYQLGQQIAQLNSDLNDWTGQIPLIRNTDVNTVQKNKVCRMYNAIGDVPFGEPGNNDFILVSYWYATESGTESFVAQTAYNVRSDAVAHRRYYNGYKPWFSQLPL